MGASNFAFFPSGCGEYVSKACLLLLFTSIFRAAREGGQKCHFVIQLSSSLSLSFLLSRIVLSSFMTIQFKSFAIGFLFCSILNFVLYYSTFKTDQTVRIASDKTSYDLSDLRIERIKNCLKTDVLLNSKYPPLCIEGKVPFFLQNQRIPFANLSHRKGKFWQFPSKHNQASTLEIQKQETFQRIVPLCISLEN